MSAQETSGPLRVVHNGQEYPVPGEWSPREWGTIKRISGERPGTLRQALNEGDVLALAAIYILTLRRHGVDLDEDAVLDAYKPPEFTMAPLNPPPAAGVPADQAVTSEALTPPAVTSGTPG